MERDLVEKSAIYKWRKMRYFVTAFHFWFALYFASVHAIPGKDNPAHIQDNSFGGRCRFYTSFCLICQILYYTLCFLQELLETAGIHSKNVLALRRIRDFIFAAFAFPMAMSTGIIFWTTYAWDRNLIFPLTNDEFIPSWLNHACHTNIMIFMILEMFLTFHEYPARKVAATSFIIVNIAYTVWLYIIKYMTGYWAYPIFDVLNLHLQIVLIICGYIFMTSIYFVGELCNDFIWANKLKTAKSASKKD